MPKFSIILNAYDVDQAQRHMTMACLAAITKFTDGPYELIVVDNEPVLPIRNEYGVLDYRYIEVTPKKTVYESYNIGAQVATTDYLFFIQNDVFVHERTINKLLTYLQGEWQMAFPQQIPISREDVRKLYLLEDGEMAEIGQRDAGLLGIRRDSFDRTGGWDGRFKNLLGEAAFYYRCDQAGVSWIDRTNAFISHIMAGNNLRKTPETYNGEMEFDAELLKEYQ